MRRNRYSFGLGTIGRDMVYSLISMYLMFYLTDILQLSNAVLWWITFIIMAARIFDALNDPVMGTIVDNTRTRFGKFKPWIALGALLSGIFTVLLFTDFGLSGRAYIAVFAVFYLLWGISFTANDIAYWSMLPALSFEQKEREKIGSFARICANAGLFLVVGLIVPVTSALGKLLGSMKSAYFVFSLALVGIMWLSQSITLFGVKPPPAPGKNSAGHTTLKGMIRAIFGNDQLLFTAVSMALFMIGYVTTTSFGLYFFKYAYGNEDMYSVFAVILGVSQIAMNMLWIGAAGILLFVGQAFIQLLMLMFLADTVEYGQWKLGKRNESVTFALQPFINKMGGAIASGVVGIVVIISGINDAQSASDVTPEGLLIMKSAMLFLPLLFILAGYFIYRAKYKIDEDYFQQIVSELENST
ncbi:MAG: sugar transporter [Spirochaetales bacterium]|nr:MAG: sugar transporter [Spirochaetales bacterium]